MLSFSIIQQIHQTFKNKPLSLKCDMTNKVKKMYTAILRSFSM